MRRGSHILTFNDRLRRLFFVAAVILLGKQVEEDVQEESCEEKDMANDSQHVRKGDREAGSLHEMMVGQEHVYYVHAGRNRGNQPPLFTDNTVTVAEDHDNQANRYSQGQDQIEQAFIRLQIVQKADEVVENVVHVLERDHSADDRDEILSERMVMEFPNVQQEQETGKQAPEQCHQGIHAPKKM